MGIDRANASEVEIAWLAIGLLGTFANLLLFVIATRDLLAVYESKRNGAKRIEAWTWHVAHGLLAAAQLIAVGIGVVAVLSPPTNPTRPTTRLGLVLALGLIAKQGINVALGLFLLWRRGKLDRYLDSEASGRRAADAAEAAERARRRAQRDAERGIPDDD